MKKILLSVFLIPLFLISSWATDYNIIPEVESALSKSKGIVSAIENISQIDNKGEGKTNKDNQKINLLTHILLTGSLLEEYKSLPGNKAVGGYRMENYSASSPDRLRLVKVIKNITKTKANTFRNAIKKANKLIKNEFTQKQSPAVYTYVRLIQAAAAFSRKNEGTPLTVGNILTELYNAKGGIKETDDMGLLLPRNQAERLAQASPEVQNVILTTKVAPRKINATKGPSNKLKEMIGEAEISGSALDPKKIEAAKKERRDAAQSKWSLSGEGGEEREIETKRMQTEAQLNTQITRLVKANIKTNSKPSDDQTSPEYIAWAKVMTGDVPGSPTWDSALTILEDIYAVEKVAMESAESSPAETKIDPMPNEVTDPKAYDAWAEKGTGLTKPSVPRNIKSRMQWAKWDSELQTLKDDYERQQKVKSSPSTAAATIVTPPEQRAAPIMPSKATTKREPQAITNPDLRINVLKRLKSSVSDNIKKVIDELVEEISKFKKDPSNESLKANIRRLEGELKALQEEEEE